MAITDNDVPVDALPEQADGAATGTTTEAEPGGLAAIVGSGDHKVIGRLWITFSLLFGVGSFIAAAISAWAQTQTANTDFALADQEFQFFTAARIGMVFLFLVPLFIGIATVICPLQVGASTIAFPRAAAAAFWAWLTGSVVLITSYAVNGGIGGPTLKDGSLNKGIDLAFVALGLMIIAVLLATICILTTIIALRTPGMDFFRVPLFSWSMVVSGSIWLLSLPVVIGNLVLADLDYHSSGGAGLFGRNTDQWPQIAWVFGQPQIFAFAIPALGIMCELVATFSKARTPKRGVLMGAIGVFGLFSFGAWAQVTFYPELYNQILFIGIGLAIGVPILVLIGGWVATARQGSLRPSGPFLLGAVSILMLLLGWIGAMLFVINPFGLHETTTATPPVLASFVKLWTPASPAAQLGLTGIVVLAAAAGAFAGLFYWGSKITGSRVAEGGAYLVALVMLVATLTYGPPFIAIGFANRKPDLDSSISAMSTISIIGAVLAVAALLIAALALLQGALSGKTTADDPWGSGQTLEWLTASPPVRGNFGQLDDVTSAEPVYDLHGDPAGEPGTEEAS